MATLALKLALDHGLKIFPVSRRSKTPIIKSWPERATSDHDLVEHWAEIFPGCNWAALTGERTSDVSIDVDGAAGRASLLKLPPLPETLTVRTGRADVGHQLHYRYPCGRDLHNSAGKIAPGIDVRGNNGVAIIPDSIHPKTGIVYSWEDVCDRATLPDSWADLIEQDWQTRHAPSHKVIEPGQDNHIEPAQADHDANPRNYPFRVLLPRHRTNGLLRTAGKLERKGAPFQRIKELLLAENLERCRPPLPTAKVISIASDVTSRYLPFDGPDPLEAAWSRLHLSDAATTSFKLRALAIELQDLRPGQPIALPVERIAILLGVSHEAVARIRRNLVTSGFLHKVSHHIIRELAQTFIVNGDSP
ncbi:MAG: bifunctional DNA primase/polymerase [Candidatus Sulfotelmatobacter sp.]